MAKTKRPVRARFEIGVLSAPEPAECQRPDKWHVDVFSVGGRLQNPPNEGCAVVESSSAPLPHRLSLPSISGESVPQSPVVSMRRDGRQVRTPDVPRRSSGGSP